MTETEFVALLDRLVARDRWLTDHAVPMFRRAAASIGRSVKDPAVRAAFDGWVAEATAVATRFADGEDITDAEVITLGVQAAIVARRLAQAGAAAEAQPEVVPTVNPQSDVGTALGSDQDDVLAQARARVAAARAALAEAEAEAFTAEMALAEIEAHTVPVQPEIVVNAGAKAPAKARVKDTRPRIHVARPSRHSVPKQRDHRPRIRRAETVVA